MAVYRFERFGTLWRDDHPLALYAGNHRLSPPEVLVWWWPVNWLCVILVSPWLAYVAVRHVYRARKRMERLMATSHKKRDQ